MVTTAILYLIWFTMMVATLPIRLFGDAQLPTAISDSISVASTYLTALNQFVPIEPILAILAFWLVFEAAYFVYKIAYWIIKKIPFIS